MRGSHSVNTMAAAHIFYHYGAICQNTLMAFEYHNQFKGVLRHENNEDDKLIVFRIKVS